ncbi:hypothetical protein [Variovorax paradoxus]|uniref:hypothetical protein n=1 Tax=Variovorax paradoxus TaxID=34073 RepID=UPI0029C6681E|nr:hypothetical protein RZE77_22060 [Variovorax paradoxus]
MTITAREPDAISFRGLNGLVQAVRTSTHFLSAPILSACCVLAIPLGVQAQINSEIANCAELKDETTTAQVELCAAHVGCRYVLNVQKTCTRAKDYLDRLQTTIGEGTRTFFGYRKEITPDAVFAAVLGGEAFSGARKLETLPAERQRIQDIGAQVRVLGAGDKLASPHDAKMPWIFYGEIRTGHYTDERTNGWGTKFYDDGVITRGQHAHGPMQTRIDTLYPNGTRQVKEYVHKGPSTRFATVNHDGSVTVLTSNAGGFEGKKYRADGTVSEEGSFDDDLKLSVGTRYDMAGVAATVNIPAERQATARAAAAAEQHRKREEAARAEQQFRDSLQAMNAGQLFARADELNAQGDRTRAREVQRALMSRFPDHQLAAATARQMGGGSGGSPATGTDSSNAGDSSRQSAFSKENSRYSSICMRNAAKAEQALTTANARRYFGGSVDLDILDMVKRIHQPCMAYDSKAKWSYDDAEQARGILQCGSGSCPRWTEGTEGAKTRQWFEIFSGEFNKMMANWEGYSRDLDPPGSSSPPAGAGANRSAAGRLSSQQCEAMRQMVTTTKVPSNVSVTASTETVMFMRKTSLDMIDGGCPGTTSQDRQEHQQAYLAAERACNQVQSGGRRCVPQKHTAAVAVSKPPVASSASSAQPGNSISYDPVTGRCLGPREICTCQPGIDVSGCPARSSGGGGIRTAR